MPVAKLSSSATPNAMKSDEGNDSLDTFIRQAIGKEPLLPFSRTGDSPVQWIQLLHALDQPDLPGWPLLTPVKVQMQKCEKCSREFCSPVNYRRHIRVHRRSFHVNKESHKNRDLLAAFWDKLSLEEAKEVMSFNDVMLKDITGPSVIRALVSSLRKPGVWTLPQVYVKAGSTLLDVIQAKPSRLPISSYELFSILDEASENTFLCAGTAESLQKYIFDEETAKNSLELKNLVAITCFLFEQQLVKAWIADKDAEALRCQKLLVEEEEAAQRRQQELLEKKKQKKLRQKEQKIKEQYGSNGNMNIAVEEVDASDMAEASGPSSPSDTNVNLLDVPTSLDSLMEFMQFELDGDIEAQLDFISHPINQGDSETAAPEIVGATSLGKLSTNRWQVSKSQRGGRRGSHVGQNFQTFKHEPTQKLGPVKDRTIQNGSRVWTKKSKFESAAESLQPPVLQKETSHKVEESNSEVMIGSIPVTLNSRVSQQQDSHQHEERESCSTEHALLEKKNTSKKPTKADNIQPVSNRAASKLWRPVSRGETKSLSPVSRDNEDFKQGALLEKFDDRILSGERCMQSESTDKDFDDLKCALAEAVDGNLPFCSIAAKKFLAQRWNEAISSDHVKLVISPAPEPRGCSNVQHNCPTASNASDALAKDENKVGKSAQVKFRKKAEKELKTKYIAKQKAAAS